MSRTLEAWISDQFVGTLHEANGLWAFEYSRQWLAHPDAYPLCPGIPLVEGLQRDGATSRPVQWYFDNLLPEEGQRTLLAGSAQLDAHDAFALLAHYGAESAGSVTLLAQGTSQGPHATHPLSDEALSRRIRQMPIIALTHEVDRLRNAVTKESGSLYETTERAHQQLGSEQPSLKPTLAGELRCLRAITKVIIADQAARLA